MMNKQEVKDHLYQEIANIGKALANPHRLRILNLLAQSAYSVEQIAEELGIPIANASQHLQVLKNCRLLSMTRKGHFVIYRLVNSDVYSLWNNLQHFALKNNLEVKDNLQNYRMANFAEHETVTAESMLSGEKWEDCYILDVRPENEFKTQAIANAHSIPIDVLDQNLHQLPRDRTIMVYCRGPLCFFADEAVQVLIKNGFNAVRLKDEVLEWKGKGLPVQ